ncbi:MAG: hypothetical protein ACUVV0_15410, partial [Anaerolineae bacterium]
MTKKRASVRGLGASIFYGLETSSPEDKDERRVSPKIEEFLEEEVRAAISPPGEEVEVEAFLEEEAQAALAGPPPKIPEIPTPPYPEAKPEVPKPETYRPPYPEAKPEVPKPETYRPPYPEAKPEVPR